MSVHNISFELNNPSCSMHKSTKCEWNSYKRWVWRPGRPKPHRPTLARGLNGPLHRLARMFFLVKKFNFYLLKYVFLLIFTFFNFKIIKKYILKGFSIPQTHGQNSFNLQVQKISNPISHGSACGLQSIYPALYKSSEYPKQIHQASTSLLKEKK